MVTNVKVAHVAAGGNGHPSAADYDPDSSLLAFGCDRNVALWDSAVLSERHCSIQTVLRGHTDNVNAVKFFRSPRHGRIIISGSVDRSVRLWQQSNDCPPEFKTVSTLSDHENTIHILAVAPELDLFVTGSADGVLKIWKTSDGPEKVEAIVIQSITLAPRFLPLALALSSSYKSDGACLLAVAGTKNIIQVYAANITESTPRFELKVTLAGHDGWIRSLAFTPENETGRGDILLASASQDKYVRLWRIHQDEVVPSGNEGELKRLGGSFGKLLSNKAHRFEAYGRVYSAQFEALLLGHEDWVYTASWVFRLGKLQLLSASSDNSMSIWESDPTSGVWISVIRLGEISVQKGSTTATGSTGGFWNGLWCPTEDMIVSLGRTGSWRLWVFDRENGQWVQRPGISGHLKSVTGISWSKDGGYLLSTSSDQTTRLHSQLKSKSWHEFSRPQIHGYDLNCVDSLGPDRFVSGADEKLLRVFDKPRAVSTMLQRLCGLEEGSNESLPEAASIPALGLSNKVVETPSQDVTAPISPEPGQEAGSGASHAENPLLGINMPPLEDQLSRYTLWPELEKLYGHGYEISALAASHDGKVIATACRASSIDHAVIRLYDTTEWLEVKPPLTAHSLTVTRLRFTQDDQYLLSVGRDRQWALFERDAAHSETYKVVKIKEKAHSRMILDAAWAPDFRGRMFATASRDKTVKIWIHSAEGFILRNTVPMDTPVTAIDFLPSPVHECHVLAIGCEDGSLTIGTLALQSSSEVEKYSLDISICPSRPITQIAWRPSERYSSLYTSTSTPSSSKGVVHELAVASEDSTLRLYSIAL